MKQNPVLNAYRFNFGSNRNISFLSFYSMLFLMCLHTLLSSSLAHTSIITRWIIQFKSKSLCKYEQKNREAAKCFVCDIPVGCTAVAATAHNIVKWWFLIEKEKKIPNFGQKEKYYNNTIIGFFVCVSDKSDSVNGTDINLKWSFLVQALLCTQ